MTPRVRPPVAAPEPLPGPLPPAPQVDRVSHRDTLAAVAAKSRVLEKQCLAAAVKGYAEYKVLHNGRDKTIVFS